MNRPTPEMEQRFSDWQKNLVVTNKQQQSEAQVSERQDELIAAVNGGGASLSEYLREQLGIDASVDLEAPQLPRMIDPSEFRDPPFELERAIYNSWTAEISAREASQPLHWTRCHLKWIEQGRFGERLDGALLGTLASGTPENKKDTATRNLLRRMGGLPRVRGKVSVLSDCPISRAWWRGKVGEAAARASDGALDAEQAHRILHASNGAWAGLVEDAVKRITVANHPRLRAALIYQYRNADRAGGGVRGGEVRSAMRVLARRGSAVAFDVMEWTELLSFAELAVAEARQDPPQDAKTDSEPNPPAKPRRPWTRLLPR